MKEMKTLSIENENYEIVDEKARNELANLYVNNINELKALTNLKAGDVVKTLGYYEVNDGGAGLYSIREKTDSDIEDAGSIHFIGSLVAELISSQSINIKQFGAVGNGSADDTNSIQKAINYGFLKGFDVIVPATDNFYKTTLPILLMIDRTSSPGAYWGGNGSRLIGEGKARSRIVKIGTDVITDNSNENINNKNSTLLCVNSLQDIERGTGIHIEELSLENYSNENLDKTSGAYALYTDVSRSTYKDINISSYHGIEAKVFSSKFENILFTCMENALSVTNGTSNFFRFLYAPGCKNPYLLTSSYTTLMNVCCDNGKGSIFTLSGIGLSLNDCGCESRNAQYIFKILNDFTTLKINNFFMHRQIGDSQNELSIEDCAVLYSSEKAVVDIDNLSICEFDSIDTNQHNSSIFYVPGNGTVMITTSLNNLRYYKNHSGDKNGRIKLWGGRPGAQCVQRYSSPTIEFNYVVTHNLEIYPFIGGYYGTNLAIDEQGNSINPVDIGSSKTIWLDCKDKYHNEVGTEIRYLSQHNKGDIQLYNDPKLMNALGLAIINSVNSYTWDTTEIPIVLRGTSEERPTTNLFVGLQYFDTTLIKPIWYTGNKWVDATGTQV